MSDLIQGIKAKQKEMQARMNAAKTAFINESKGMFKEVCDELFNALPELQSFGWSQYTPYFNDGDVCRFRANVDELYINGWNASYESGEEPGYRSTYEIEKDIAKFKKLNKDDIVETLQKELEEASLKEEAHNNLEKVVREALKCFKSSMFKELFNDHTVVTVNRDGTITQEEYQHD